MRGRIAGVVIAWLVVLVVGWRGMVPGGWIHRHLYPRPSFPPASEVRMGIRVTADGICARRVPDADTVEMDVAFTVERLDGRDWDEEPLLSVSVVVLGAEYGPMMGGRFLADGRAPFDTAIDLSPRPESEMMTEESHEPAEGLSNEAPGAVPPRRYLYRFPGLPRHWMDASLVVRLAREIPKPDFDLGTFDFAAGQTRPAVGTLIRDGTVVRVRGVYQGPRPHDPEGGAVTRLDVQEELPFRFSSRMIRMIYPRYGRLVVHDDGGELLRGVRTFSRAPSVWGFGGGGLYVLEVPPAARQPRSIATVFISSDAMVGDAIEFIVPRLTTLNGV